MSSACCFNDEFPAYRGNMEYFCLGCNQRYGMDELHYTCPKCGGVFLLNDLNFEKLRQINGQAWRGTFDMRAASKRQSLRGIFRFYELIAPVFEEEDIVYLGEGNTPIVAAAPEFATGSGARGSRHAPGASCPAARVPPLSPFPAKPPVAEPAVGSVPAGRAVHSVWPASRGSLLPAAPASQRPARQPVSPA